jgi:hypothetical protein
MGTGVKPFFTKISTALVSLLLLFLFPGVLNASGDGPRVHGPAPVGANILVFHASSLNDANRSFDPSIVTPFLKFDTSIGTIQYARTMELGGRFVLLTGMLRGGNSTRKSKTPEENASSSGLADPTIAAAINLMGIPPLSQEEFREYRPGTVVNLFLSATLPLGEYNTGNLINLGSNRWTFRLGVPIVHPLDWIPGKLTTLELVPNLLFFTENSDKQLKQDPLLSIEGNVTQNITSRFWGSAGFLYSHGGKTKIHGVQQNGTQKSLSLSASLNYTFSPKWVLSFRFGETVASNEFGLEGSLYHLKLISRF